MIEKNLANLAFETIALLTKVFLNREICLETYISNTVLKIRYLESYIDHNADYIENIKIIKLLMQYKSIVQA